MMDRLINDSVRGNYAAHMHGSYVMSGGSYIYGVSIGDFLDAPERLDQYFRDTSAWRVDVPRVVGVRPK